MMPQVLSRGIADKILASGLLAHLFYIAKGTPLGGPSEDIIYKKKLDTFLEQAKDILCKYADKIILPSDFAYDKDGKRGEFPVSKLPSNEMIADIGSGTIAYYKEIISSAATVFVNGPAGIFEEEQSESGTKELLTCIAESENFSVIGGGDSIAAINKYNVASGFSYVCTGGGAMVRFLSGEELPVVAALKYSAEKFK